MSHEVITMLVILGLVGIHVLRGRLATIPETPRSRWLSFSAGVPVAFVFLALLPALANDQEAIARAVSGFLGGVSKHVYAVALVGFIVFYGTERAVKQSQANQGATDTPNRPASDGAFLLSVGWFSVMNAVIGYLLVEERRGAALMLFAVAMALKFVVNDYGLHKNHQANYDWVGKYVVSGALVTGWIIGVLTSVHPAVIAITRGFLAGGVR